jgi:hypothetical protein
MQLRNIFLILGCYPLLLLAQLDHFAVVENRHPDFGGVSGTWGHLQFYRPFGMKGIVVDDWRDLTVLSPLSGEPVNTDRQGWIPHQPETTLWEQLHPALTAPADTTAASTLVNYKQGDGVFKDFTLWYHNSLDAQTRFGWTSKLRSHPRIFDATVYDEQRHRIQVNTKQGNHGIQLEAGYNHQVNPLYMIAQDTSLLWYYDDVPQVHSNRWDGSFEWTNLDSNSEGSELFAWVQGGVWTWSGRERRSLSQLAYASHRFDLMQKGTASLKVGWTSKLLGGNKRGYQFLEFLLPQWTRENFSLELGLRMAGKSYFSPLIHAQYGNGPLLFEYQTYQIVEERIWDPHFSMGTIQELTAGLNFSSLNLSISAWRGDDEGSSISGYSGESSLRLPWQMSVSLGGAFMNQSHDWIFSKKYISWGVNQELTLFNSALQTELKVWGKHLFATQPGMLDPQTLQISASNYSGEEILHLLNYTLSGQVSAVIVSFTDQNILQDELWSGYGFSSWNSEYILMTNQIPNSRYRYLSIIWTFDN